MELNHFLSGCMSYILNLCRKNESCNLFSLPQSVSFILYISMEWLGLVLLTQCFYKTKRATRVVFCLVAMLNAFQVNEKCLSLEPR